MKQIIKIAFFPVAISLFILLCCSTSHSDIINGSFESGLNGFYKPPMGSNVGEFQALKTLGNGLINPTDGNHFLYISTGPGDVRPGSGDTSFVKTNFFLVENGVTTLSLDFNLLTGQAPPSNPLNDIFSIYCNNIPIAFGSTYDNEIRYQNDSEKNWQDHTVIDNAFSPLSTEIFTATGSHYTHNTGWYHLVIGISDFAGINFDNWLSFDVGEVGGSELFDTALLIDNIRLNSAAVVPEPSTLLLLGLGLLGIAGVSRKKTS